MECKIKCSHFRLRKYDFVVYQCSTEQLDDILNSKHLADVEMFI